MNDARPARIYGGIFVGICAAFALRLALAFFTIGSNDAVTWLRFAGEINWFGFPFAYRFDSQLNHPPLAALYAYACLRCAVASGHSGLFNFFFKLPAIFGDAISCWILYRIGRSRNGPRAGLILAAAMAWSPVAIAVSGYHANTDNLYAMLMLASVWFLADRDAPLLAGLCFAAALNVKLMPLPMVFPLLALCRSKRSAALLLSGVSVAAVPFLIAIAFAGKPFVHNVLQYKPVQVRWGIVYAIRTAFDAKRALMVTLLNTFSRVGPWLILASSAAMSLIWRRGSRGTVDPRQPYGIVAAAHALTLIFATGFGVQYLVGFVPLLFAYRLRLGIIFSLLSGAFVIAMYVYFCDGGWPWLSDFISDFPHGIAAPGVLVWLFCVFIVIEVFRNQRHFHATHGA